MLVLRKIGPDDRDLFQRICGEAAVMQWVTGKANTPEQSAAQLQGLIGRFGDDPLWGVFVAVDPLHSEPVGIGGIIPVSDTCADIGYRILPPLWGRGYGGALARELVALAQAHGISHFQAVADSQNTASIRILEKIGFRYLYTEPNDYGGTDHVFEKK